MFDLYKDGAVRPVVIDCHDRPASDFIYDCTKSIGISFSDPSSVEVGGKILFSVGNGTVPGGYRIRFSVTEEDGVCVAVCAHTSDFSDATVRRIAEAFGRIVIGLIESPRLSDIQYTSQDDLELQDRINGTQVPLEYDDVLESFRLSVSAHPGSVLVTYLDHRYTYAEADRISDSIASSLASAGISRGDRVAVMTPRSEWYILCTLGVLKTGAAYVPIDTSYPDDRIAFMLSDSSVKAVLVTPDTSVRSSSLTSSAIIDCTSVPISLFAPVQVSPSDTAVILYTSGTTGRPKGTELTHLGLANFGQWNCRVTGSDPDDVFGLYSSFGFDAHLIPFTS